MSILDEMPSIVLASRLCLHGGQPSYLILPTPDMPVIPLQPDYRYHSPLELGQEAIVTTLRLRCYFTLSACAQYWQSRQTPLHSVYSDYYLFGAHPVLWLHYLMNSPRIAIISGPGWLAHR